MRPPRPKLLICLIAVVFLTLAAGPLPVTSALAQTDTDLDGRPDDVEGDGDIDGDGIPNVADAHDFWVSGEVEGADGSVVWLIGGGQDDQIATPDDVVVGKADGPAFRFENVNDGAYVVVAGDNPATTDPALRASIAVSGAPVEGVSLPGGAGGVGVEAPVEQPSTTVLVESADTQSVAAEAAPSALSLDTGGSDPFLIALVAVAAFLFGVLLASQSTQLSRSHPLMSSFSRSNTSSS